MGYGLRPLAPLDVHAIPIDSNTRGLVVIRQSAKRQIIRVTRFGKEDTP
jgi:hypothetical protein